MPPLGDIIGVSPPCDVVINDTEGYKGSYIWEEGELDGKGWSYFLSRTL